MLLSILTYDLVYYFTCLMMIVLIDNNNDVYDDGCGARREGDGISLYTLSVEEGLGNV